jgi:hypothetical protein
MRGAILYGPRDVRFEERPDPRIIEPILPEFIDLIWNGKIDPGKVFDLQLPLEEVAEGYRAMDERRAIKTLLRP